MQLKKGFASKNAVEKQNIDKFVCVCVFVVFGWILIYIFRIIIIVVVCVVVVGFSINKNKFYKTPIRLSPFVGILYLSIQSPSELYSKLKEKK